MAPPPGTDGVRDPHRGMRLRKKELKEALDAGKTALHTTEEVMDCLDSAEGWSTWDVMGGGLGVDLAKYDRLDEAQEQVERLQVELRRFKTELTDVEINADLQVTVDGFMRFADYFFDNLFTDWAVLDHISQAQEQVKDTRKQIQAGAVPPQADERRSGRPAGGRERAAGAVRHQRGIRQSVPPACTYAAGRDFFDSL